MLYIVYYHIVIHRIACCNVFTILCFSFATYLYIYLSTNYFDVKWLIAVIWKQGVKSKGKRYKDSYFLLQNHSMYFQQTVVKII